jgi:hypothetical protein
MNTKRTRLLTGVLSAMVLSAPVAMALTSKLTFTSLRGTVHVAQEVPCGDSVNLTTSIANGRIEITPSQARAEGAPGSVQFDLNRADLFVTPFSVPLECFGISTSADFREIGAHLVNSVRFTGEPIGRPGDGQYRFLIPKEEFLIYESVLNNAPVRQPERTYVRPNEDVTGVIDLRQGTVQMQIALASRLHLRFGCVSDRCVFDDVLEGTQTVDVTGAIVLPRTTKR